MGRSAVLRREHLIDRMRLRGVQDEGPSAKSIRLSMPTRRHIAFSPFEAQRAPHEGSVPYVNGKRFHADVCGEKRKTVRGKKPLCAWSIPHVGD